MINRILDRAERHGGMLPAVGGANLGLGLGMVSAGGTWGWVYVGFGVLITGMRPVGTSVRRRYRIRRFRRELKGSKHLNTIREWGERDRD